MSLGWQSIDDYLRNQGVRIGPPTASQTTGGSHTAGSNHYLGLARDYGDANSNCPAVLAALLPLAQTGQYFGVITELFYKNTLYKNGKPFTDAALSQQHSDHVHAAIRLGADISGYSPTIGTATPGAATDNKGTAGFLDALVSADTAMRFAKVTGGALLAGVGMWMVFTS